MPDYIDTLRKLGEAATEGPWEAIDGHPVQGDAVVGGPEFMATDLVSKSPAANNADAQFIATARNLWPLLVDVLDAADDINLCMFKPRLHDALQKLRQAVEEL